MSRAQLEPDREGFGQALRRIGDAPGEFVAESGDRHAIWRWASRLLGHSDLESLIRETLAPISPDLAASFAETFTPVEAWPDRWFALIPVLSMPKGRMVGQASYQLCHWADWPHGAVQLACFTADRSKVLLSLRFDGRLELTATGHVDMEDYFAWSCRGLPQGFAEARDCPFAEAARLAAQRELAEETALHVAAANLEWKGTYGWRPPRLPQAAIPHTVVQPNHELRGVFCCEVKEDVATNPPHEPWPEPGFDPPAVQAEYARQTRAGRRGECLGLYWVETDRACREILGCPASTARDWAPPEHVVRVPDASWKSAASGLLGSLPLVLK